MLKKCITCNLEKPIELFYFRKDTGKRRSQCSSCYKKYDGSRLLKSKELAEDITNGIKLCPRCNIKKPLSDFNKDSSTTHGYVVSCKVCKEVYRKNNLEKINLQRINKIYNLSKLEYDNLIKSQNNKCAICNKEHLDNTKNKLFIDHNHTSGKVRGLLCHHCNVALGSFYDNIDFLKNAIVYLEKNN
jgi:hypothetical protein